MSKVWLLESAHYDGNVIGIFTDRALADAAVTEWVANRTDENDDPGPFRWEDRGDDTWEMDSADGHHLYLRRLSTDTNLDLW